MPDMENVINGLNYCMRTDGVKCPNCTYWQDDDCVEALNADALALLKEQDVIVRCKDCIHYRYYGLSYETVSECTIDHCENPDADWFCADGERR